jgi:histidinol phosphatase-like PHP family hydrolase
MTLALTNGEVVELLARDAEAPELSYQRRRALRRAARAALSWPEEAAALSAAGRPLTELRYVGPWLAHKIADWLAAPPSLADPPPLRRGFRTAAEAQRILAAVPDWPDLRGDLQTHTLDSDGTAPVAAMAEAASERGHEYLAITDHSQGLKIANGMDTARLAAQGEEIGRLNAELAARGAGLRVLRAIEMNLSPAGEGDMDVAVLADLDLVLGAFHSKLRITDDQTDRYLAALRHPALHVLAHPRGRIFNFRAGLRADWRRVFDAAAAADRAVEIDAYPDRQDLDVALLEVARASGVRISIGSDAHAPYQLAFAPLGSAAALAAGIPRERILNFMPRDELLAWSRGLTDRTTPIRGPMRARPRTPHGNELGIATVRPAKN